jgi:hypothetical protein
VYCNDGLRLRTDWRFAIIKVKGKFFSVHAMKAERGGKYSSSLTSPQNEMDVRGHPTDPASLFQERSTVLIE